MDLLVGRTRELDALRGWLDDARAGAGRLVLCAGEPGIGKTRLAQELAGLALARGTTVVWGRCVDGEGAPPFWPWLQVLRTLGADGVLAGDAERPEDRFRLFDEVVDALAAESGLVVVLDDVHWADEPSLLLLRHVADRVAGTSVLVFAGFRDVEPASVLPRVLPDLLRSPSVQRIDLRGLALGEVRELSPVDAETVHDVTGGNPLFVREIARAIADGSWRPDQPPRSVLDVVRARLAKVSSGCRNLLQASAVAGREFPIALVGEAIEVPPRFCLSAVDEAISHGLIEEFGLSGGYRFVHALTRDAVEASLDTGKRLELHRSVAAAIEKLYGADLGDHLADLARHWTVLAPYGEAATARGWLVRAAQDAVAHLAYEEGAKRYRAALALDQGMPDDERCAVLIALGRTAKSAGDLAGAVEATVAAGKVAVTPEQRAEVALVLDAVPDPAVNAVSRELGDAALAGNGLSDAVRARLLAQRSQLAFYDGDQPGVESQSAAALALARTSGDDRALHDALVARKAACPGPAGLAEREQLAAGMLELARRSDGPLSAMWGRLWRIEALVEHGRFAAAAEELPVLRVAVERIGGPVSAWHLDRTAACIAQAQGRYDDARESARRAHLRMLPVEPGPAMGAYFALQSALVRHLGITDEAATFVASAFEGPPRFRTVGKLSRASILMCAGKSDEALASYRQAGPIETWSLPVFFVLPAYAYASLAALDLNLQDQLPLLFDRLEPHRGRHAVGDGVAYLGPVELTLGRLAAGMGRHDDAVADLTRAVEVADRCGAAGYLAEGRYHLALALMARGDRAAALPHARAADGLVRSLGMKAYVVRTADLLATLSAADSPLSPREAEVAELVAEGLTNRQIAKRLFLSERTAQNHVAHILTKLGFTSRSQIAAWVARAPNE